jgi:hypothetical protein
MKEIIDYNTFQRLLDKEFSVPKDVTWNLLIDYLEGNNFSRDSRIQDTVFEYDARPDDWVNFDSIVFFNTTFTGETFQYFHIFNIKKFDVKKIKIIYQYEDYVKVEIIQDVEDCIHQISEYIYSILLVYISLEIKNQVNESSLGIPVLGKFITDFKQSKMYTKYLTQQDATILEIKKKAFEKNKKFEKWIDSKLSSSQIEEMKSNDDYSEIVRLTKGSKIP